MFSDGDQSKTRSARVLKKHEGWRERAESNLARKTLPAAARERDELRPASC